MPLLSASLSNTVLTDPLFHRPASLAAVLVVSEFESWAAVTDAADVAGWLNLLHTSVDAILRKHSTGKRFELRKLKGDFAGRLFFFLATEPADAEAGAAAFAAAALESTDIVSQLPLPPPNEAWALLGKVGVDYGEVYDGVLGSGGTGLAAYDGWGSGLGLAVRLADAAAAGQVAVSAAASASCLKDAPFCRLDRYQPDPSSCL